jgi:hypothetical protein
VLKRVDGVTVYAERSTIGACSEAKRAVAAGSAAPVDRARESGLVPGFDQVRTVSIWRVGGEWSLRHL